MQKRTFFLFLSLAFLTSLTEAQQVPLKKGDQLQKLDFLIGKWNSLGTRTTSKGEVKTKGSVIAESMPKWLQDHFKYLTFGSGRWIADNAKFKSENEPFDEYGTEWTWGVGKKSIRGRLFALKEGKEVAEFWEYRVFWHPAEMRAVFEQFGAGGVFGTGEMRVVQTAECKSENNVELTFYGPDGASWKDLHKLWESPSEHTTISFDLKEGSWQAKRRYVWKKAS
jgi:hypothetical protein